MEAVVPGGSSLGGSRIGIIDWVKDAKRGPLQALQFGFDGLVRPVITI
jgi:hypothetical protein